MKQKLQMQKLPQTGNYPQSPRSVWRSSKKKYFQICKVSEVFFHSLSRMVFSTTTRELNQKEQNADVQNRKRWSKGTSMSVPAVHHERGQVPSHRLQGVRQEKNPLWLSALQTPLPGSFPSFALITGWLDGRASFPSFVVLISHP